jgi:hypothetical protein
VYNAVTESIPPPRPIAFSLEQTLWPCNMSSFANSSTHHKHVDDVLKEELSTMYIRLRDFNRIYFRDVANLKIASKTFFKQYIKGSDPLFDDG